MYSDEKGQAQYNNYNTRKFWAAPDVVVDRTYFGSEKIKDFHYVIVAQVGYNGQNA